MGVDELGRQFNKLSARSVATASKPGYHSDGNGLYLQVSPTGTKSWILRYSLDRRAREMGLGPLTLVSLAEARQASLTARKLLREGVDPTEERARARQARQLHQARSVTFEMCAEAYIEAHAPGWRNAKHAEQWRSTLKTYAFPIFGDLPVQNIDTPLVMKVLDPIWHTKTETASRVRGRLESVLDWAKARRLREGDNPALWRGHLDQLLPKRSRVQKVVHHPALPFDEMGAFMCDLAAEVGIAARGFEFQILTAARTGEVIGARWDEVHEGRALWVIPGSRMKAGREHRVALSGRAIALLSAMRAERQSEFVFSGRRLDRPLSNMAFLAVLKRMGRPDLTAHGFRSSFRDWAAERTDHSRDVVEMALAHSIGDKVEAAYRRGDLFEKRALLMEEWAGHCFPRTMRAL